MDFLGANEAVIDLQTSTVTFSTRGAIATNDPAEVCALRVVYDDVTVPPRSSVVVFVRGDASGNCGRLAEGKTNLLLQKKLCSKRPCIPAGWLRTRPPDKRRERGPTRCKRNCNCFPT